MRRRRPAGCVLVTAIVLPAVAAPRTEISSPTRLRVPAIVLPAAAAPPRTAISSPARLQAQRLMFEAAQRPAPHRRALQRATSEYVCLNKVRRVELPQQRGPVAQSGSPTQRAPTALPARHDVSPRGTRPTSPRNATHDHNSGLPQSGSEMVLVSAAVSRQSQLIAKSPNHRGGKPIGRCRRLLPLYASHTCANRVLMLRADITPQYVDSQRASSNE